MPLFWFFAGMISTLAALCLVLPGRRPPPLWDTLMATRARGAAGAALLVGLTACLYVAVDRYAARDAGNSFGAAARAFAGASAARAAPVEGSAGSMDSAVASLEARLAKNGGSDGDWELLAKSFEFLGRSADAAAARRHEMRRR